MPRSAFRALAISASAGLVVALTTTTLQPAHASTVRMVAQQDPHCSDQGPGTVATPFCTITMAAKVSVAGDTVDVAAGTYREQVRTPSGVTFTATSPGAIVTGADNLAAATWTATSTGAWSTLLAAKAAPTQVFSGPTRLAKASAPDQTTKGSWAFDSATHTLYVDLGGPAPTAADGLEVSVRSYGFLVRQVEGVSIEGFTLVRQGSSGVLLDRSTGSVVQRVSARESASYGVNDVGGAHDRLISVVAEHNRSIGIRLQGTSSTSVVTSVATSNGYHGISVQGGSSARVAGNTATDNLTPGIRRAAGIDVSLGALDALVERNVSHDNDDSGIQIYSGSSDAVVRRNLSYDNGDHGLDISKATGVSVVSNTVVGNATPGLNIEGASTGTSARDNIVVDNAVGSTRGRGDVRVDAASVSGTTLDHDLVYESDGATPLYEWNGTLYDDLAQLRSASGQESHGLAVPPGMEDLDARDLRLGADSPALDVADATARGWADRDLNGASPVDQPDVVDGGLGSVRYADLGAVERTILPPDDPPVARLSVSPTAVDVGQVVTLDASESTDDHGIAQYAFTCDADGPVTANTAPTATCVYESGGDHEPAVTVTDTRGNTASSSQTLTVTIPPTAPTAAVTATPSQVRQGVRVTVDASGSLPGQGATITSYTFTCGTQAALPSQTSSQATCRFPRTGDERVQVRVTNDLGLSTTAATDVHVVTGLPPTARITVSPRIGRVGRPLHVDASTSRGTAVSHIVRYRYRCGSHPPTSWGTRSTTVCRFSRPGRARVTAWVRSDLGLIDQTVKTVRIRR